MISQREVGQERRRCAARAVLRQDPDVIMIGEIRDEATMEVALRAAQTGHLVLSTMHTVDATETVNRSSTFSRRTSTRGAQRCSPARCAGVVSQRRCRPPTEVAWRPPRSCS